LTQILWLHPFEATRLGRSMDKVIDARLFVSFEFCDNFIVVDKPQRFESTETCPLDIFLKKTGFSQFEVERYF
jgi:hypothetical protein